MLRLKTSLHLDCKSQAVRKKETRVFLIFFRWSLDKTKTVLKSTTYLWDSWVRTLTTGRPLSAVSNVTWLALDTVEEASIPEIMSRVEWVAKSFVNVAKNL